MGAPLRPRAGVRQGRTGFPLSPLCRLEPSRARARGGSREGRGQSEEGPACLPAPPPPATEVGWTGLRWA